MEQGLASDPTRPPQDLVARLQRRELQRVGAQFSQDLGLDFTEAKPGVRVEGTLRQAVQVGDAKYALVERSRDFTLLPWKQVQVKRVGQTVGGVIRDVGGDVSWTVGRTRGIAIS